MNMILDVLSQKPEVKISIFTSRNSSSYATRNYAGVRIHRFGSITEKSIVRYSTYLTFNLLGTIVLLITRPDTVLVYETLSVFPAYFYSRIFLNKKVHIHFHEYTSLPEKKKASLYMKFLFKCEEKLLRKCTSSQTNKDRKELFSKDNTNLKEESIAVYPNMPPRSWWIDFGQHKKPWEGGIIKLVFIGVLDAETMYLEEILNWVKNNQSNLELTLISHQYNKRTEEIIQKNKSQNIFFKKAIDYYNLPNELVNYDVGLVLYKGHIPNYVYNVPNKVFEYLNCGLNVIADNSLKSLEEENLHGVIQVSLEQIDKIDLKEYLKFHNSKEHFYSNNICEII